MKKQKTELHKNKHSKGQVLVILAITLVVLVAVIGLAVDLGYVYVSYARLRRATDSAALAGTSEFKKNATTTDIVSAGERFMGLNEPIATNISVETCDVTVADTVKYPGGAGDPALCTTPPRKLVRVTASEEVPTFFMSVIGFNTVSITAQSTSEAASLEMVLVIDRSESMAWYAYNSNAQVSGSLRDPKECNLGDSCHPFAEVKQAAEDFLYNFMYYPYDRAGIITFDRVAERYNPSDGSFAAANQPIMTNNVNDLLNVIDGLTVFEGFNACHLDGYAGEDHGFDLAHPLDNGGLGVKPEWVNADGPCRLYNWVQTDSSGNILYDTDGVTPLDCWPPPVLGGPCEYGTKSFQQYACPLGYQAETTPNFTKCGTSNTGAGLRAAAQTFGDFYQVENIRQEALWVTLLLTDGVANIGWNPDDDTDAYCPAGEASRPPFCTDKNTQYRHCLAPAGTVIDGYTYDCMTQNAYDSGGNIDTTTSTFEVNVSNYDADDYARDQADLLHDGAKSLIFAIGLNGGVSSDANLPRDPGTPIQGLSLLTYIAKKGESDTPYLADNDQLPQIFLAIANKIATRLTK